MIKKIKVVNSYGEELVMTLSEPQESGYAITNVSGLEPTQVDVKQTQTVSGLRYKYNFGFHKFREINVQIVYFEWNDLLMDVETLRDRLYRYFKTNDLVTLYFERDYEQYAIQGYVSKHDSVVWSANCGATITVTCPDPWFRKRGIDYQDEVLADCVQGVDSDNYVNTAVISYDGNIGNGFALETETDVRNLVGEELILESRRDGQVTGTLVLNVPKNYPDTNVTIDSLGISLVKDSLAVYTRHIGGLQYFLSGYDENGWTEGNGRTINCVVDGTSTTITLVARSLNSCVNKHTGTSDDMFSLYSEDSRLSKIKELYIEANTGSASPSGIKCFPVFNPGINAYLLLVFDFGNIGDETYFNISESSTGTDYKFALGYVASDKIWLDEDRPNNGGTQSEPVDHIGWVDATSISKRTPLPRLEPGYNTVSLNTSSGRPVQFKIKYNTLYRGL